MFELYLVTFNCARNLVNPESLAPPLFDALPPTASLPDVVAISLQEVAPIAYSFLGGSYLTPYFDRVTTTVQLAAKLRSYGREQLDHIATRSLGMTGLMVFAKPQFAERIQWIQSAGAGVGFWNMGNKGAVALRLGISCGSSGNVLGMTFIAAHLAPMECNVEARNKDWENIVRNMVFLNNDTSGYTSSEEQPLLSSSSDPPQDNNGMFTPGSHVFFAGDLNYRTHDDPPGPTAYRSYPQPNHAKTSPLHYSHLLETDQLRREKEAGRTLHGFEELPVDFPPTYKYSMRRAQRLKVHKRSRSDIDETWEWVKHRYPSWCDRILFLPSPPSTSKLIPQVYTALPVQLTSDHRPVALSLEVESEVLETHGPADLRSKSPFPINPNWRTRRDAARRMEVIVGVLSYFALTKKGNAVVVAVAGVAFGSWWMATWLQKT
ncbi:DNase I-like protein [Zopfia rhizophila CBS 207.26]|uniref:DNase I-like protein n=1 Tax=Zopfia rhizophila CBS 207.26 TaxID=1314779 RepID=A0A6A6DYF5_9PEZI|nr:DNase I-like protein [Zopfia rhizophila CBS 207.26]